jgi:hypothetical protein
MIFASKKCKWPMTANDKDSGVDNDFVNDSSDESMGSSGFRKL